MITIAHLEPMAQGSLKAKSRWFNFASMGISCKAKYMHVSLVTKTVLCK